MKQKPLTQSMRQVLQNLADKKPAHSGMTPISADLGAKSASPAWAVLQGLHRRALVRLKADANYEITPKGLETLEEHKRKVN